MSLTIPSTDPILSLVTAYGQFKPWYRPDEVLNLGVFGGAYFSDNKRVFNNNVPKACTQNVPINKYLNPQADYTINFFVIEGKQSNRIMGMPSVLKKLHPLGWFNWYAQYYYGIQSDADTWRIKQWLQLINTHWFYIANGVYEGEGNKLTDLAFLPERRQALLELAWDPTRAPIDFGTYYSFE